MRATREGVRIMVQGTHLPPHSTTYGVKLLFVHECFILMRGVRKQEEKWLLSLT